MSTALREQGEAVTFRGITGELASPRMILITEPKA